MKNLSLVLLLGLAFAGNVYAQKFGTAGMWTYKKADGFNVCQNTIDKNNNLVIYSEIGGTYAGLVLTANNKTYSYDEDRQQFNLLINGKSMRSLSDVKKATSLVAVYAKGKRISFSVENMAALKRCL